ELSKSMYVMSPYTSLLVLENDAMYERFKVDRGRKDRWALYPCPEKIPVVTEPVGGLAARASQQQPAHKRPVREVLESIVVRVPPRFFMPVRLADGDSGNSYVTGLGIYESAQAASPWIEDLEDESAGSIRDVVLRPLLPLNAA